ncbi:hypothetical protein BRADI_1g52525v3 [Brachypodium distachyon]|uniref:Uncharacterized protein n=1 Tax=Brachypodium distachyon TaxID=15368 RepID=A0A0Q3K6D5_BRADI|nr:hypothetical protein BRADI_1g52525v3 [Brachypodium distachyon]
MTLRRSLRRTTGWAGQARLYPFTGQRPSCAKIITSSAPTGPKAPLCPDPDPTSPHQYKFKAGCRVLHLRVVRTWVNRMESRSLQVVFGALSGVRALTHDRYDGITHY